MSNHPGFYSDYINQKRKSNNTQDNHFQSSTNTNTKSWTTTNSSLSDYIQKQNEKEFRKQSRKSLKVLTKEEIEKIYGKQK